MYSMYFTITSRCNQCCTCCPYTEEDEILPDMEAAQIKEDVTKAIAMQKEKGRDPRVDVILSGGEPTLHPDLPEMIGCLQKLGASVHILSNGERFADPVFLEAMDRKVDWRKLLLTTTLHSQDPEEHEKANRKKGSFQRTIAGLHRADERGALVTVKHCVTGSSCRDLNEFYDFADREFPVYIPLYLCGIDYVGIPPERIGEEKIGLPQVRPALEALFDKVEEKKAHRRVYASHIPLCWTDPYYWRYLTLRNPARLYKAAGRTGETNWNAASDTDICEEICGGCRVKELCMGTYKSAYRVLGQEGFRPFRETGTKDGENGDGTEQENTGSSESV